MLVKLRTVKYFGLLFVLVVVVGSVALVSAPGPTYTASDKEFYADPNLINFVRPGLVMKVTGAEIATDGTIKASIKLTDPRGLGLDRLGVTTPGTVSVSVMAAYIPKGKTQYVSYTTRVQTSPITGNSATQAGSDSGGTWAVTGDGEYTYIFRTKAPAGYDRTATHTIGIYGNRNLSEFELPTNYDDDFFNFVPDGSKVVTVRDVTRTATCNKCHDQLAAHGGSRRSIEVCVLCHTPQTTDPDTGNTVDMPVMTHKIHMGKQLPSVVAGTPYKIIGNQQSVHDYSTVVFPADPRRCNACHDGTATQANNFYKASRAACGACHDNVNFATGEKHVNLPQVSDNQCTTCHTPEGELEFDASIKGAHTIPTFSRELTGIQFELQRVENNAPGKNVTVLFNIKDKTGKPILPSKMSRLALVLAGPATDYTAFQTGYVAEDALKSDCNSDATACWYTFKTAIPSVAKGTYSVGIEGRQDQKIYAGTVVEQTVRYGGLNKVLHFSVDGTKVAPRRTVVTTANCNKCHSYLSLHGANRNQIEQCVLCHNPVETDKARRPAAELPAQSVDFRMMIHKIHTGEELGAPYIIYGYGGSKNDFSEVRYPALSPSGSAGDRRNCSMCHVAGSEKLPLKAGLSTVNDPRGYINPVGPASAACLSCHVSIEAASHALLNTSSLGESCTVCHGSTSEFSVSKVHAR
jgi:OmcA/MtrC family decaheme c-type cytochrome